MNLIDTKIETGLQILDEKETSLIELKARCSGLKIVGLEDKAGFKAVREARLTLKDARVQIQKDGKSLRENAIRFQKAVIEKENQLIELIAPTEKELQQEEEFYNSLVEQERVKKEKEENERIQKRIDALAKFNHGLDVYEAKIMEESDFQALLGHAEAEFIKDQERIAAQKAEEERLKAEALEAQRLYEERIKKEREELERQKAEYEAQRKADLELAEKARKEREYIEEQNRKEQQRKEAELKAEREKLEAEKRAIELEKARAEAADKARLEEQARVKREAEEKVERERLAKLEADRKESLRPDKEKLLSYIYELCKQVPSPELKEPEAKKMLAEIFSSLDQFYIKYQERIKNL
jgi:hypothetical protein